MGCQVDSSQLQRDSQEIPNRRDRTMIDVNTHLMKRYRFPYVVLSTELSTAVPSVISNVEEVLASIDASSSLVKRTLMLGLLFPDAVAKAPVLVITSQDNVPSVVNLLRSYHHMKMVGSSVEHDWLGRALDFVVTCPEDVCNHDHAFYICAAVVDEQCHGHCTEALEWLDGFSRFSGVDRGSSMGLDPIFPTSISKPKWLSPQSSLGSVLLDAIKSTLPEAAECLGLGDGNFMDVVETFARSETSIFSSDWSGFVGLMPGLLRGIDLSETRSMIVAAPAAKVVALAEAVKSLVDYMGLVDVVMAANSKVSVSGKKAHIVVGTPDLLLHVLLVESATARQVRKLVVVQAEQLDREKVERVLHAVAGAQLAFAASQKSSSCQELLELFASPSKTAFITPAKMTMSRVHLFVAPVVSPETKLDKLVDIWERVGKLMSEKWSVVCNSRQMVEEVAEELEKRDVPVCVIHSGMDREAVKQRKREFDQGLFHTDALVITDVSDRQGWRTDMIMYELPRDGEEYLKRCGSRLRVGKVVINLICSNEDQVLLDGFCECYGLDHKPLPVESLNKRFLKKHHRF